MKKRSILIICRTHLARSPRFMMEVSALKDHYNLIAAGESFNASKNDFEFVSLIRDFLTFHYKYPLPLKKFFSLILTFYFKLPFVKRGYTYAETVEHNFDVLKKKHFDLVIVHFLFDLPLAVKLAKLKNVKLIFNAHEYYPLELEGDPHWMKHEYPKRMRMAETYFPDVAICFCVGKKIADKYKETFGLDSVVITNAKQFYSLEPRMLREGEKIKIIHHGNALYSREIHLMIEMMGFLGDNYELDLMLVTQAETGQYINELKEIAGKYRNVRFIEPVAIREIPVFTNTYDIGLFLLPPSSFTYKYALPNKFFEFIQARLAIAIGPSPEMEELVRKYDLGVVADDFSPSSMANKIKELSVERIMYHKNQSHKYARELSMEQNEVLIKQTVDNLLKD